MSVQQFCLRWNNHQPNFISVCSSLLHNGTLVDVTLAAEGRQLQAHKIVLSACSSYFQTLFTTNPCQHPIVILKDVQYDDLKTMVDFMYYGEVNVSQEQLPHILKTAEMLKIKGLAEMPTDPANLTKTDSKSSNEPEILGNGGAGGQGGGGNSSSGGGLGSSSTGGSVNDSLWGSTESQFQQQQQHHHQVQQQQQQQQQQQHHHHQQQQQQQQHHHQQQHQTSQTQTTQQQHHQLRRTPSPLGAGASPATRRKRLRKSSNNGSGDRNNAEDQHNAAMEAANAAAAGGISLSQMSQISFAAGAGAGGLGGIAGHSLHAAKLLKESSAADLEPHPQDSDSLDDGHGHVHMQIKPEVDIGGIPQSIPLDISGTTTPSEQDAPNSQSSHSDAPSSSTVAPPVATPPVSAYSAESVVGGRELHISTDVLPASSQQQQQPATAIGSTSRRHPQSESADQWPRMASITTGAVSTALQQQSPQQQQLQHPHLQQQLQPQQQLQQQQQMGTKRNRVLIRQPRVKRDSDSLSTHQQVSPEPVTTSLDLDTSSNAESSTATLHAYQPTISHHHLHHHHLLTVPPRIERHASEPTPTITPSSPHLLSVPHSSPYLTKQHSDPLLPSQHAALSASGAISGSLTNPFAPLHRQYSHPLPGSSIHIASAPIHHHISLPESAYASGSPPPAGSSHYIVPQTISGSSSASELTSTATTSAGGSGGGGGIIGNPPKSSSLPQFTTICVDDSGRSSSPASASTSERSIPEIVSHAGHKFRTSKSASGLLQTDRNTLHPGGSTTATSSSSFEHLPTLRVKNEELQRSVSSPQTTREITTLENPRSSHCPAVRPGPALGCNFCWNTIDGHGRILRRKTKYHCPECQTNLCIVPCFQEYHERLNNEAASGGASSSDNTKNSGGGGGAGTGASRHYNKTETI